MRVVRLGLGDHHSEKSLNEEVVTIVLSHEE